MKTITVSEKIISEDSTEDSSEESIVIRTIDKLRDTWFEKSRGGPGI